MFNKAKRILKHTDNGVEGIEVKTGSKACKWGFTIGVGLINLGLIKGGLSAEFCGIPFF